MEALINKRYDRMEALRAETYPLQLEEFDHLCSEIDTELDIGQRVKWAALVSKLKNEYLPLPPVAPPTADFIVKNFDANNDNILESSELPPPMWMRVRNADSDSDGKVTRSEFEALRRDNVAGRSRHDRFSEVTLYVYRYAVVNLGICNYCFTCKPNTLRVN